VDEPAPVAYRFADHLSEAETTTLFEGKTQSGVWKKDRFVFPAQAKNDEIKAVAIMISGKNESGVFVYFSPGQKSSRWISFRNVPPGRKLNLFYGLAESKTAQAQAAEEGAQRAFMSLRIFAGRHELKRIHVGGEKGWKKTQMDLGIASFLRRDLTLTFELTADNTEPCRVVFGGELLK
jgi:hypothetical protein